MKALSKQSNYKTPNTTTKRGDLMDISGGFTMLPHWVLDNLNLSPEHFMMFCIIARETWGINRKYAAISNEEMKKSLRCSLNHMLKVRGELEQLGYISVQKTNGGRSSKTIYLIAINSSPDERFTDKTVHSVTIKGSPDEPFSGINSSPDEPFSGINSSPDEPFSGINSSPDEPAILNKEDKENIKESPLPPLHENATSGGDKKISVADEKFSADPYRTIADIYQECCPTLPVVHMIDYRLQADIRNMERDCVKDKSGWSDYFKRVAASDYLTGQINGFKATFSWLLKPANYAKVVNGNFDNKTRKPSPKTGSAKNRGFCNYTPDSPKPPTVEDI